MGISVPPAWDVNARVQASLHQHEHPNMTDERLATMKAAAQSAFAAAMRDRRTDPELFELLVHIDELVGPMAFVLERDGQQRHWPLPAFQAWLSGN
jgi:hypothetical protein